MLKPPMLPSLNPAVQRLPPEMLCEIFNWTMVDGYFRRVYGWQTPTAPWRLTHVCQAWRDAARACPTLWSSIHIVAPDPAHDEYSAYLDDTDHGDDDEPDSEVKKPQKRRDSSVPVASAKCQSDAESEEESDESDDEEQFSTADYFPRAAVETQLQLSQSAPLDVVFDLGCFCSASHLCKLLRIVVRESNRWSALTLRWVYTPDIFASLAKIKGRLSQLESLKLLPRKGGLDYSYWPHVFADIFGDAPRLRCAALARHPPGIPPPFSIPHHQLTHVRLWGTSQFILNMLPIMANTLVDATLEADDDSDSEDAPISIELPHVKRLSLANDAEFQGLLVPRLASLTLPGLPGDIRFLPEILDRSQCHLKTLNLGRYCYYIKLDVLLPLLRLAPDLLHLRVEYARHISCFPKDLPHALAADSTICPRLVSIDIDATHGKARTLRKEYCELVEAFWNRTKEVRSLRSVRFIRHERHSGDPLGARVEKMRVEGLEIEYASEASLDEESKEESDED
ncbi:hypothetical protein R3P38DRAFT_2866085 [Favolaschia claudopus]|uniref:F-box domain-containing protein n=1 Tax=Favolaschia claudopus TaxID=2862362 RepID=A0AAW0DGR2_9AGAR